MSKKLYEKMVLIPHSEYKNFENTKDKLKSSIKELEICKQRESNLKSSKKSLKKCEKRKEEIINQSFPSNVKKAPPLKGFKTKKPVLSKSNILRNQKKANISLLKTQKLPNEVKKKKEKRKAKIKTQYFPKRITLINKLDPKSKKIFKGVWKKAEVLFNAVNSEDGVSESEMKKFFSEIYAVRRKAEENNNETLVNLINSSISNKFEDTSIDFIEQELEKLKSYRYPETDISDVSSLIEKEMGKNDLHTPQKSPSGFLNRRLNTPTFTKRDTELIKLLTGLSVKELQDIEENPSSAYDPIALLKKKPIRGILKKTQPVSSSAKKGARDIQKFFEQMEYEEEDDDDEGNRSRKKQREIQSPRTRSERKKARKESIPVVRSILDSEEIKDL